MAMDGLAVNQARNAAESIRVIREEFDSGLALDPVSGLPIALLVRNDGAWRECALHTTVSVSFDGIEERGVRGGVAYRDTEVADNPTLLDQSPLIRHLGTRVEYEFPVVIGGVRMAWIYVIHPTSPAIDLRVRIDGGGVARIVRQFELDIVLRDLDLPEWRINLPGNQIRRDVLVRDLGTEPIGVSPIGGLRGSSGLILVTDRTGHTIVVWPNNPSEISTIVVSHDSAETLRVHLASNLAADAATGVAVDCQLVALDLIEGDLLRTRDRWPGWASRNSLTTPPRKPAWVDGASLYEVQIGTSLFRGGHTYCPYPTVTHVIDDLDRVTALGFDVIQIMPRHPYPSYNVHDYFDIEQSYGDPDELLRLVRLCHDRGVRVILDVLLHGVIDRESLEETAAAVRSGPFAHLLDTDPGDVHGVDIATTDSYSIAWSRHILDFEEAWRDGSPERARLQVEHPEWFFRDSQGAVTSVYTKAFDARHSAWRRYFRSAMRFLMTELGIDGFRFDAPTYNDFANWSGWSRDRASASVLACVALFEDLRQDIKQIDPDALMYTEPSGHLLRRSMDVNYNYDEQWLVSGLVDPTRQLPRTVSNARQFLEWMEDRDAFLPPGSATAHHIDSHDTFWWPAWGSKWRREQIGVDATRALAATFMSLDGPFMMFTGGEVGIEALLSAMNTLRHGTEGYWRTPGSYTSHRGPDLADSVLSVQRTGATRVLQVFVNLSPTDTAAVPLPRGRDVKVHFSTATDERIGLVDRMGVARGSHPLAPYGILLVESEQ